MQIFVDADACPVVGIVEKVAKEHSVPVTLLCDTNHVLSSDYSEVLVVGAGADAVDYKLISICHKGDIVVSQDYGVAAMALGKNAYAIHQSGKWYTNENIDQMLMERHLNKKARRASGKKRLRGSGKIVGGIYDDRLLVKPTKSAISYMPTVTYEIPYENAKEMLLVEEVDNKDFLTGLFDVMYDELPTPKPKKKK